jgi:two-component system, chemotaxis family, chemotaxis protein CheY
MALVVDDDPDARVMVIEYLRQLGFRDVTGVEDGRVALEFLTERYAEVGLIVSDWEMPEISGLDLLRACKSNPTLREIPFLMITSQTSMERMKIMQAAQASVDQYLLKPFTGAELKKRVDRLLETSRTRREVVAFVSEAGDHLEHGRYKRAQDLFESALTLDPANDAALRGLGDTLTKVKGAESALPYYKRAVDSNPMNPKNHLRLSSAYEQVGLVDKAILLLESANLQISFSAELHFHLGRLYNRKGMGQKARAEFEKTLEIQLDHQEARLMLEMMGPDRRGSQE